MNLNLYPIIEKEKQSLLDIIKNKADFQFVQEDLYYLRELDDKFAIDLHKTKLLYYHLEGHLMARLWHRLIVYAHKDITDPKKTLRDILNRIGMGYFRDDDAHGGGLFYGETDYGSRFAYCYVNPDFKNGYWENHVLEVEPDLK